MNTMAASGKIVKTILSEVIFLNREYDMVKLAQWAQIIQSANESKLGRKEWCAENGITESSFYYWQRRVRKYALSKMLDQREHDQLPSPDQEPRSEEKGFYEISLNTLSPTESSASAPLLSSPSTKSITIHRNGFLIDVEEGFSQDLLSAVLKVISNV